jgi:hypothetical protein
LPASQLLPLLSGVTSVNAAANISAVSSGIANGNIYYEYDAEGRAIALTIYTSGVIVANNAPFKLLPAAFYVQTGSQPGTGSPFVPTAATVVKFVQGITAKVTNADVSITASGNVVHIQLPNNLEFRDASTFNSGTIQVVQKGVSGTAITAVNSGVWLNMANFRRVSDTELSIFVPAGGLKAASGVDELNFIITSGAFVQTGSVTFASDKPTVTVNTLTLEAATSDFAGYVKASLAPVIDLATGVSGDTFAVTLYPGGLFLSDVNISHFKFAGLNSGVQPSLDLALEASDTTVIFTGFTNLQGNLDFVYINPLAIIRGTTFSSC